MRRAVTLIELLVVVGIVALLIGLLIPAVIKVRESALIVRSENQLKNVALASLAYTSENGEQLPWMENFIRPRNPLSTHIQLLPYIEQQPLYEVLVNNHFVTPAPSQRVQAFISPVDAEAYTTIGISTQAVSFVVNACLYDPMERGRFSGLLQDGSSNTIGFAEIYLECRGLVRSYLSASADPRFMPDGVTINPHVQRPTFADGLTVGQWLIKGDDLYPITSGNPPTSNSSDGRTFQVRPDRNSCDPRLPNALTNRGLQVAMADGSVRFIKPTVEATVFWAAVTPRGGETFSFD